MTDTSLDALDVEIFIEEVKKRPSLWDTSSAEFHDRAKRRLMWHAICRKFHEGFDEKSASEKSEINDKYIKKWRNIKNSYFKSVRRNSKPGEMISTYLFSRYLTFLNRVSSNINTSSNVQNEEEDEQEQQPRSPSNESASEPDLPPVVQKSKKRKLDDLETTLINFMNTPAPTSVPEFDPDKAFFESLLPSVKCFPEDMKLEFRSEVINLIKKMRSNLLKAMRNQPNMAAYLNFPYMLNFYNFPQPPFHNFASTSGSSRKASKAAGRSADTQSLKPSSSTSRDDDMDNDDDSMDDLSDRKFMFK